MASKHLHKPLLVIAPVRRPVPPRINSLVVLCFTLKRGCAAVCSNGRSCAARRASRQVRHANSFGHARRWGRRSLAGARMGFGKHRDRPGRRWCGVRLLHLKDASLALKGKTPAAVNYRYACTRWLFAERAAIRLQVAAKECVHFLAENQACHAREQSATIPDHRLDLAASVFSNSAVHATCSIILQKWIGFRLNLVISTTLRRRIFAIWEAINPGIFGRWRCSISPCWTRDVGRWASRVCQRCDALELISATDRAGGARGRGDPCGRPARSRRGRRLPYNSLRQNLSAHSAIAPPSFPAVICYAVLHFPRTGILPLLQSLARFATGWANCALCSGFCQRQNAANRQLREQ